MYILTKFHDNWTELMPSGVYTFFLKFDLVTKILTFVCLFVFVALRPMSTAMVIAGRSVHLTTLFPGQA